MSGEKKVRNHKFLDKHTVLGVLLLMFGSFILIQFVIGTPIGYLVSRLTGADTTGCVASFSASSFQPFTLGPAASGSF